MLSKSVYATISSDLVKTIEDAISIKDFLKYAVCYTINRITWNEGYPNLNLTYDYNDNSPIKTLDDIDLITSASVHSDKLTEISWFLDRHIANALSEFYMHERNQSSIMNINCLLVNKTGIMLVFEIFQKG